MKTSIFILDIIGQFGQNWTIWTNRTELDNLGKMGQFRQNGTIRTELGKMGQSDNLCLNYRAIYYFKLSILFSF